MHMERVTVTVEAAEVLKGVLDDASAPPEQTLRLITQSSGDLGLSLDTVREGDQVVENAGQPVLAISDDVARLIDGSTIEVVETEQGKRLTVVPRGPDHH